MMYITGVNPDGSKWDTTWHVGQRQAVPARSVIEVQADGDELMYVLTRMSNLPYTQAVVQTWYGDHAKFIAGNLPI